MPAAPPSSDSTIDSVSSWPHDASAAGAEHDADRELLLARLGPREQQVRDVRARDEQHRADRQQQHEQRRPDVAEHFDGAGDQREAELAIVEFG